MFVKVFSLFVTLTCRPSGAVADADDLNPAIHDRVSDKVGIDHSQFVYALTDLAAPLGHFSQAFSGVYKAKDKRASLAFVLGHRHRFWSFNFQELKNGANARILVANLGVGNSSVVHQDKSHRFTAAWLTTRPAFRSASPSASAAASASASRSSKKEGSGCAMEVYTMLW